MKPTHLFLGAALGAVASASPAYACGGFFCNNQQIDQAGEHILFSYEPDGSITTVVQIQYTGPSESFAWILPVPAEPTVGVGTDELFRQLEYPTAPSMQLDYQTVGSCRMEPSCWSMWETDDAFGRGAPSAGADAGVAALDPGVMVLQQSSVGPYDYAVLSATDGDALRTWLNDHDFLIPDAAGAMLDHYVGPNGYFVSLRLRKTASAGEIQPIVLRSTNDEPCIPIVLTAIASVPDMPITAYFLADRRARPFNYMLVNPDLESPALWTGQESWSAMVTRVVDDAGGHGFVTDYAGVVPTLALTLPDIDSLRTSTDVTTFLNQLRANGFNGDSQLLGVFQRFIPPPEGADPRSFYNCLTNDWCTDYDAYVASLDVDFDGLVDALTESIIVPRREAQAMLDSHAELTRLFSTMSSDEMTVDPEFMLSDELPLSYSNVHRATVRVDCGPQYFWWTAPQTLITPSGRAVPIREGVAYRGTDAEYCTDRGAGFTPYAPMERLREIAHTRDFRVGGGSVCNARPGPAGAVGLLLLAGAALLVAVRRRRR